MIFEGKIRKKKRFNGTILIGLGFDVQTIKWNSANSIM
jgi:hypothetical protein